MTNYNERLDEALNTPTRYIHQYGCACTKLKRPKECDCKPFDTSAEAKQALTSLIKELVADAKPEKRTPDYYSDSIDLYSRQCAANSWNKAIDQFEQNLLKALEEV